MTAMTRTSVLNLALREIGAGRVEDYTEDTPEAIIGRDCWDQAVRKALSRHEWQFAMLTAECGRAVGTPVARYLYRYSLPADVVRFGQMSDNTMFSPKLDDGNGYALRGGFVETSAESLFIDYVYDQPAVGVWPAWFIDVMVADYASVMCSPLKATTERERMEKLAEKRLNEGRSIDSSQRPRVTARAGNWRSAAAGRRLV
jgi:hypothetical protein